jgi:acetyl esterase/lipase
MKLFKQSLLFLLVVLMVGCSRFKIAAVNAPVTFSNTKISRDISYGPEAYQKLDIYAPPDGAQNLPIIVFFYGGRWAEGSKNDYGFVADTLAKKGFMVIIPDYDKYPKVRFPVFVEDGAKALAWVDDHIEPYGGNSKHIYLMGHSAGAHIASLVITDPHYLKAEGKTPNIVCAFAGLAGPYDFTPDEPDLINMFGPPQNYPKMQATSFITGHEPPMLLLRGDKDKSVAAYNMVNLATQIHAKGGKVETKTYPGLDHIWIIGAFSWAGQDKAPIVDDVVNFFRSHS